MMKAKLNNYIRLLRPHQWLKNLLILFPPFFAGKIHESHVLNNLFFALAAFSLTASCGYIINDIKDAETDRNHEIKKRRVIANGDISKSEALALAVFVAACAVYLSMNISPYFRWYLTAYLTISVAYTLYFKHLVIIDIFFISAGFIVRVLAGGDAFNVKVTNWLFLTVFLVALFLSSGKRMGEVVTLGSNASTHRRSLINYSRSFLEGILWFTASASLVTYALYSLENDKALFYTVPLAAFGLLRYAYIVHEGKGDPTESLIKDVQILTVGVVWLATLGIMIYYR